MGEARIEIDLGESNHGCDPTAKRGLRKLEACGNDDCPDCLLRDMLTKLRDAKIHVKSARLRHFPGTVREVVDTHYVNRETGDVESVRELGEFPPDHPVRAPAPEPPAAPAPVPDSPKEVPVSSLLYT